MTEQEQIEEMALVMCGRDACKNCTHFIDATRCAAVASAKKLYAAGYRKQTEGEWLFEFTIDGDDFYKCSICGRQEVLNGLCYERTPATHYPYCHCGAKMKGGEQG